MGGLELNLNVPGSCHISLCVTRPNISLSGPPQYQRAIFTPICHSASEPRIPLPWKDFQQVNVLAKTQEQDLTWLLGQMGGVCETSEITCTLGEGVARREAASSSHPIFKEACAL